MLVEWHDQKVRAGQARPKTVAHQLGRLQAFFAPVADQDIAALTPRRAAALYQDATQRVSPKTREVLAAASHRLDLWAAQTFYRWAVRQGHVGASPFREVRPIGKVNTGKPQLRIEEARRFTQAAVSYFEEKQHPLAIGALLALTMGLRTGEVLERVVRDLDDGARYLWIDAGKTSNARRRLEVPEVVQPYLSQLAANKPPEALLFGASRKGGPHAKQIMWEMVKRLCARAGVPIVCTHSLRGLWATLAVESGAASHAVAANLGHHSFAVTERHYAQSSAVANAATARVLGMIGGERAGDRVHERLTQLDANSLARLLELLESEKKAGAPK
jgi:integrase